MKKSEFNITHFWKPLLAITFWGMSFVATKIALGDLAPFTIVAFRLAFGILVILPIAIISKRDFWLNKKIHGTILILALVAVGHLWIQITGLKYTTATNTGWIIGITPVFMALLGLIFFKEKLNLLTITGIITAFIGLLLLISKGNFNSIGFLQHKGDLLVLTSAFTWSVYSMVNKKITINYSPLMTVFYSFVMMLFIIIPFLLNDATFKSVALLSSKGWMAILFLGIFCSGFAYVLWAQSLKDMEAAKVGVFLYFEPFVTVFTAWIVLDEKITFMIIFSGIIITLGVLLVNKSRANVTTVE